MKLKNFMFATMIACAFASCSEDDAIENGPVDVDGGVSLAIKVNQPQTKAATDADIKDLTVLVFNGQASVSKGVVLEKKATATGNVTEVKQTQLTPGNKTVLVLANASAEVAKFTEATTTFQDVLDATTMYEQYSETIGDFSMNSKAYEVSLRANVTNYLGYGLTGADTNGNYLPEAGTEPVKLYRNVAKIVLKSITVKEAVADGLQYPKAELKLKQVFILHGHNTSKLVGADATEWGTTNVNGSYINGVTAAAYELYKKIVTPSNKIFNYLDNTNKDYAVDNGYISVVPNNVVVTKDADYAPAAADMKTFYTYENTDTDNTGIQTLLVIQGDFSYDGVVNNKKERITEKNRYYSFAVGSTGTVAELPKDFQGLRSSDKINGVLRNLQYETTVTVAGPGYKTPVGPTGEKTTFLDVKVKVVPFGIVTQDVEIK